MVITAIALVAAYFVTGSMEPNYRSQARCFMPAQTNTVSLSSEEGNVPNSPLLPTANADFQDSMLGILQGSDTRALVASRIQGRDSEWLKKNVEFGVDRFNLLVISAFDPEPKMALEMANQYLAAFKEKLDETAKDQARERQATFVKGVTDATAVLAKLQENRLNFMREHGAVDFDSELAEVGARQIQLEASVSRLATNIATAAEQKAAVIKQFEERPEMVESALTTVNNPAVEQLQRDLNTTSRELANLLLRYTVEHPDVVAKAQDVAFIEAEIAKEAERILGTATSTRDALANSLTIQKNEIEVREVGFVKEKELTEAELEKTMARRLELSLLKAELDTMDAEIRNVRNNITSYRERKSELDVYISRDGTFLTISEYPVEAVEPYFPILWVNLLVAAVFGITVGVGLVIVITNIRAYREEALW